MVLVVLREQTRTRKNDIAPKREEICARIMFKGLATDDDNIGPDQKEEKCNYPPAHDSLAWQSRIRICKLNPRALLDGELTQMKRHRAGVCKEQ